MSRNPGQPKFLDWPVWIYSSVLIAAGLAQTLRKVLSDTGGFGSRYAGLVLAILIAVGLFARSRKRAVGPRWIWVALLWSLVLVVVALLGFSVRLALERSWPLAGWLLGGAAVLTPGVLWLWDYGYRSPHLWARSHDG